MWFRKEKTKKEKEAAPKIPSELQNSGTEPLKAEALKTEKKATTKLDTIEFGSSILKNSKTSGKKGGMLNKEWWYSKVMDWSMKSTEFKTKMFRFVDVFPYLNSGQDVLSHVDEYFKDKDGKLPALFQVGSTVGQLAPSLVSKSVEKNIKDMARLFITGESPEDAMGKLTESRKNNIAFTADLLGELTLSEEEAQNYKERYLDLMEKIHQESLSWEDNELLDFNHLGPIPKVNVSVKMSSLYSQIKVEAWEKTKKVLVERLKPIFTKAIEKNIFINIDMEHYQYKDLTLELFESLLSLPKYSSYPHFGIVIQAYLKDSYKDCERLVSFAKKRGVPFTIRLVKGAYWDHEVIHAKQNDWPVPVYTEKENSDYNFEKCAKLLLQNHSHLFCALGSHNLRSISESLVFAKDHGVPQKSFEIQMLYGMADQFKESFTKLGYRVREYATIGELVPGMAYLVRRLLENSSNQSFLQSKLGQDFDPSVLFSAPHLKEEENIFKQDGFINAPLLDFTIKENRSNFEYEISKWQKKLSESLTVTPISSATPKESSSQAPYTFKRQNPNKSAEALYQIEESSPELVTAALEESANYQKKWSSKSVEERSQCLVKAAQLIEKKRFELASLQSIEVGKPWHEADADITEAIDFCLYYAEQMKELSTPQKMSNVPGEESFYYYQAKGPVAVIAPWNFPLAILCGMTVSALVTGNTVLMKPAEQSSLTALQLYKILIEAGIPKQACHFLPGRGETVGAQLVESPEVHLVSFTGSLAVGLHIIKEISKTFESQRHVKKAVIEMGGKNPLIIDSDADLDQAVAGTLYSAFAFSGQKCSALSRVIVVESIYDKFCQRLKAATESLVCGEATDPAFYLGPVVDQEAYERILNTIEENKKEYQFCKAQLQNQEAGNFIPPHVFFDVQANSSLATEEIFGPVLAVVKVKDIKEALEVANNSKYALTGGIYSRMPSHIELIKKELECGNLYINRSITGALVKRHPFGGYKLSGLGSKAGGPDYLKNFLERRVVTENLVRQGFSPDIL